MRLRRFGLVLSVGMAVAGSDVQAQARDSSTARPGARLGGMPDSVAVPLAPITVTATRSGGNRFEVPLAISVVPHAELFGTNGYGLERALSLVPGVIAQSRYGTSDVRITIRGFGARGAGDRSNAGTARGIRVLLDGFPETEPDGRTSFDDIDLAAASRVEVVRSNASAEWGNAAGGVISVSTMPAPDQRPFSLEPAAGSYGLRRYALRAGAHGGAGQLAASVVRTAFDGWRAHSAADRTLVNLGMTAPLAPRTELRVFAVASANRFDIPGPLTLSQVTADPRQANGTYLTRDERRDNKVARIGTTLSHRPTEWLDVSGMLFVNPKVLHRSERGTFRDFTRYHVGGNTVLKARGALSSSLTGAFLAGTDAALQDGAILFYSLTPEGNRGGTLQMDKRESARNFGVFTQGELTIGTRVKLALGARYDDITYHNEDFLVPRLNAQKSFTGVSPKVGVTWLLSPTHSFYASIGGGVEAPAGNETDPASTFGQDTVTAINPLLDPIRSTTYEVGTKYALSVADQGLLRGLTYDLALFLTEVTNEIVPYRGGRFYFTAGQVRRRGTEVGATAHGPAGMTLSAAWAIFDFRYRSYVVDSVHYGRPGATADYSGNRVVGVPVGSYTLSAAVSPASGRRVPVQVRITLQGMSSYFVDDANRVDVPRYHTVSLTAGLDDPASLGAGIGLAGFVTVENLLDRAYIGSAFLNPDIVGGVPVAFEPGMPRHLLVGLSLTKSARQ